MRQKKFLNQPWLTLVLLLSGLTLSLLINSCDRVSNTASAGAQPPMTTPVGPPPGPDPVLAVAQNPYAESQTAMQEGRKLFLWFNCAGCHGDHAGGGMGPSLRDVDWIYGKTDADIFSSIAEGRAHGMPAWGTKLPNEQIWKLVTYIKALRTAQEPDAPPPNPSWPQPQAGDSG